MDRIAFARKIAAHRARFRPGQPQGKAAAEHARADRPLVALERGGKDIRRPGKAGGQIDGDQGAGFLMRDVQRDFFPCAG